jgi:integrase/recombinase XerD
MEEEYLKWKSSYTISAGKSYASWVRGFRGISGKGIEEATLPDMLTYSERVRERYSPGTAQLAITVIRDYASFVSRRKKLLFDYHDIRSPRGRTTPYEPITEIEYVTMLTWARVDTLWHARDNLLLRMLYDTGMRISELLSLDFEDIDIANRQAFVDTRKTTDRRLVFWGKDTNEFLQNYMERRGADSGPIFVGERDGWRLTVRSAERIIREFCRKAGIRKRIVCHSFRHGKAWRVLDNGGTVKDVQFILGHRNPVSSFYYLNLYDHDQTERARRFLD